MASYSHALRQAHREDYNVRWASLFLQTLWHLAMIAARVSAIVAFASVYKAWIFVAIGKSSFLVEKQFFFLSFKTVVWKFDVQGSVILVCTTSGTVQQKYLF